MKEYRVTYKTENGEDSVTVPAVNEKDAYRVFKRNHSQQDIIEAVETGRETCAYKWQETEALNKIESLIDGLGEGSYLATAFEGCVNDARNNIRDDFGDSMKKRYEHAESEVEKYMNLHKTASQNELELKAKVEKLNEELTAEIQIKVTVSESLQDAYAQIEKLKAELEAAKALEVENMKLKAKLYDLMTA